MTQNSINNNSQGFKNSWMDMVGCVWVGENFLKEWQVADKIIESILSQFVFNHLWMIQTQKIITHRVSKIHKMDMGACVWVGESFLSHEKWEIKLLGDFLFTIHIVHFTNDSNSRNNNSQGFKDSQMDMRGCVWVEESFLWNDKWQIKLLSEFFSNSHSTFYKWLKLKN